MVGILCVAMNPTDYSRESLITSTTKLLLCLPSSLEHRESSQLTALPESMGHSCWINLIPLPHKEERQVGIHQENSQEAIWTGQLANHSTLNSLESYGKSDSPHLPAKIIMNVNN